MTLRSLIGANRRLCSVLFGLLLLSSAGACGSEKKDGTGSSEDPSTVEDAASEDEDGDHADASHDAGKPSAQDAGSRPVMDASGIMQRPVTPSNNDAGAVAVPDAAKPAACGAPGQACCPGDLCASGCCVNDICLANGTSCGATFGTCMDNACTGCGKAGQNCCPGRSCQQGAACGSSDTCVACGGADQRCCADHKCAAGVCVGSDATSPGICKSGCGAQDQMCCSGAGGLTGGAGGVLGGVINVPTNDGMCVAELACLRGKCTACGGEGEACCPGLDSCDNSLQCVDSKCQKCGHPGEVCCAPTTIDLDGCAGPLNLCQNGLCTGMNCGLLNEACCPTLPGSSIGACSAAGTYCIDATCKTCGGIGEPCCTRAGLGSACSVRGAMCMSGTCKMP